MTRKQIRNMGASLRARLLKIAQSRNQQFELILVQYVLERLLYRLSQSDHRNQLVLKGAILTTTWFSEPHRPTRDVDFLSFGDPDAETIQQRFDDICRVEVIDDGVKFDAKRIKIEEIRKATDYGGLRVHIPASVGGAKVIAAVDLGFGDATEPGLEEVELPVLLDLPPPRLRAYSRETQIAEKFQALIRLGLANTRLKDFFDIWLITRTNTFSGERLTRAIAATFERRQTPLPSEVPDGLTAAFFENPERQDQWNALLETASNRPGTLASVARDLETFLMPPTAALHAGRPFTLNWSIGGPWTQAMGL
jgi:predicted nucleotidyltransferase component of viral defense system